MLISSCALPILPIRFMVEPQLFFMVLKQVVACAKSNGHTCSMSPELYCPRVRLEIPHVLGLKFVTLIRGGTLHVLISS